MKKLVMVEFYFDDRETEWGTYDEYYFVENLSDIKNLKEVAEQSKSNHYHSGKKLSPRRVGGFLEIEPEFTIVTSYVEDDFDFDKNDILKEYEDDDDDYKYNFRTSPSVPGICKEARIVSPGDLFQELRYEIDEDRDNKVEKIQDKIKKLNLETMDNKEWIKTKEEEIIDLQRENKEWIKTKEEEIIDLQKEINLSKKWANKLKGDLKTKQQSKSKKQRYWKIENRYLKKKKRIHKEYEKNN